MARGGCSAPERTSSRADRTRRTHIDARSNSDTSSKRGRPGEWPARRPLDGRAPVRHRVHRGPGRGPARGRPLIPTEGAREGGPRVRLYDADGQDREVELGPGLAGRVGERQLLWIDL